MTLEKKFRSKLAVKVRLNLRICAFFVAVLFASSAFGQTASRERVDLLVSGGTIVTMDGKRRVIQEGAIAVKGDTILAIGPRLTVGSKYTAARLMDARGKLILPGLINGHTHAAMTLLRGLKDDVTLEDWLTKSIFPAEARNVTEEYVRWGTRLAALEMIQGGTTTYADMYYFEDAVAEETKTAGMRGVLGETVIDFPVPDSKNPAQTLAYTEAFFKRWVGDAQIHAAVAPHSIYTCSQKTLQDSAALARKYHAPILIHVLETKHERDESEAKNGMSSVRYLERIGVLGPDVLAAHCVWVDDADRKLLASRDAACVHNPSSNMMLASGVAPVLEMRAAGVRLGLGTDGPAGSNNDLNMMEEMDLTAKLQKVTRLDPRALGAKEALEMATIDGARALHMEKEIGSLEPGKKADFILIGMDAAHAVPLYQVYSQIVYALKASDVQTVVIGGKIVMRDRKVLTLDEPSIITKAREYGRQVERSLAPKP